MHARLLFLVGPVFLVFVFLAPIGWARQAEPPAPAPSLGPDAPQPPQLVTVYNVEVMATYPHDPGAFTQGLLWHEGWLYESTGRVGASRVRKVDLATGRVERDRPIPFGQFGEGLALWEDELISLTWRDGVVHRWRLSDLAPVRSFADYPYEGWGLARYEDALVASDGTATLRFLDPDTYKVVRSIDVTLNGRPLASLNELEVVDGLILANIWKTDYIVGIDPRTGAVRAVIDCRALAGYEGTDPDGVLNGIAWDAEGKRLFVTGKLWSKLYHIELRARQPAE
ncbi:MAG: glutaminyl-peptide cyclotransferase [Erythrobacter sp.]|uniref:glutaminyl-peptide cyclotransferase n=1 Tax=Erythrobacter sp. TaxID=1042 RepID=UPI00262C34BB|nr:glutaminyl-peptide cyclotransferase [Erythrobacter sp.]MDJ0979411.1 glutaminyl-peptide cyclotransferase [Erythrobacter sp.]